MIIRPMASIDLCAARTLLDQLGYPLSPEQVASRFEVVASAPGHAAFVAEVNGAVRGLVHVYHRVALEKPPEAVVQALVVDSALHGRGIGRALMLEAERWALARGLRSMCLSSHASREGAHAFYQSMGFGLAANSVWLRKALD